MAFLKSSLTFAERFLDGLDDKLDSDKSKATVATESGDKPVFQRRSAAYASSNAIEAEAPTVSPAAAVRSVLPEVVARPSNQDVLENSAGLKVRASEPTLVGDSAIDVPAVSRQPEGGSAPEAQPHSGAIDVPVSSGPNSRSKRASSGATDGDAGTMSALMTAIQDKDAKIVQFTVQMETLRRQNKDLTADLDDMEAELRAAKAEAEKGKKTIASLEGQVKDAYSEATAARARLETMSSQLESCDPSHSTKLSQQVDALHSEVDALKTQLARAETARTQAQEQMTSLRTAAQRREDELMVENKELTAALAAAEISAASGPSQSSHMASVEAEVEAHIRREAAAAAEAAMLAERRLSSERLRQLEQATQQLAIAHDALDKAKAEVIAVRAERDSTVGKLRAELATASSALKENRTAQLETRLATLADSLVEKQGTVDQLISEKSSLTQRLELERQRRRVAEDSLTALQSKALAGDFDHDVEEATPSRRPRTRPTTTPITKIEVLSRNPTVAQAADTMDRFCLRSARFLGVNPYARLVFFAYLVLLHLWALFILSFHTHQLDVEPVSNSGVPTIITPGGQVLQ